MYVWRIRLADGSFYRSQGRYRPGRGVWMNKRAARMAQNWSEGYDMKAGKMVMRDTSLTKVVRFRLVEDPE